MRLKTFVFNQLQVNTYLLTDEATGNSIVIDPGCSNPKEKEFFAQYVAENSFTIKKVLNTHLHFDHIYGNRFIQETFGA
jgi:glyoxylase-like metal-dependent hydrolase (beta-lactamase superfamily II)